MLETIPLSQLYGSCPCSYSIEGEDCEDNAGQWTEGGGECLAHCVGKFRHEVGDRAVSK